MRFLLSGGGTGGHYFPALAVARCLIERGHSILYVGSYGGIERRLGFPSDRKVLLKVSGVVGKGVKGYISSFRFVTSTLRLIEEVRSFQPDAALIFGGYASLPSGLASLLVGIPLYVQEQNSVPGRVSRLLSLFSRCSFVGFPTASRFLKGNVLFTGNPVRKEIVAASRERERMRKKVMEELGLSREKRTLLVLGGSQGALWINSLLASAAPLLSRLRVQVLHVSGTGKGEERLKEAYRESGVDARVFPFYSRVWELYSVADAAVSRAGAMAISELSLFGIPTLFVPYPYASDGHQLKNAKFLSESGAAVTFEQEELTPTKLVQAVEELLFSIIERRRMEERFLSFSRPNATEEIVETVCGRRGS